MTGQPDPRAAQTRKAILGAFAQQALNRRYDAIRIAELIAAAGVGRSTFYEHFRNKDEVLLAAVEPVLAALANAATGRAGLAATRMAMEHLWRQRTVARVMLDARVAAKLQRRLAGLIVERMERAGAASGPQPHALLATAIATGQLGALRMWVAGETSCSADALARLMNGFTGLRP